MGYAKKLVDAVQEQFPNIRCIEVRCRRDYNLEEFWKACGFHVIDERAGRKKSGSTLTIWHRDVNQYDLLYLLHQEETQNKLLVTLDTNILIDLFQSGPISDYLFDDYLEDYVAYRITPEVMDEVNRNKNDQTRKRTLDFCKRFQSVIIKDGFDQLVYELSSQFDTNNNHTRDIRHLELTDSLEERIGGNDSKQIRAALLAIAHRDPLQLEKTLSPLLIKGLDIPTYVIPVKPDYAAKLFDEELLSQTYLDNPYQDASLSIENSYFTASKCRFLCQCRIVWYG